MIENFHSHGSHAVGVDMIETDRVARVLSKHPIRFLERVYTEAERAFCRGRVPELAARFAAKEAVMKMLGTGARSVGWKEIEVLPDRRGKPLVYLYGGARRRAQVIELDAIDISLTHLLSFAMAVSVGHVREPEQIQSDAREFLLLRLRERGLLGKNEGDAPEPPGRNGIGSE